MPAHPRFLSHRLIWLALLLSLGIGALFAHTVWTMREDAWQHTRTTNANLVSTLAKGLEWSLGSMDASLQGAVEALGDPDVWQLLPTQRARLVFDASLKNADNGDVLVLNAKGTVVLNSGNPNPGPAQLGDRDYFQVFAQGRQRGLYIGRPAVSRVSGQRILPVSRAYYDEQGQFAGVVVGVLRMDAINGLLAGMELGADSGMNLLRHDGLVITRFPYTGNESGKTLAGTPNMERFLSANQGSFVGQAALDGVQRLYTFQQLERFGLIINVAQSTDTILAHWARSAWILGSFALVLMGSSLGLAWLFIRELHQRQRMTSRLSEAEHDIRAVLNALPSAVAYWDRSLHHRLANEIYLAWFGTSPIGVQALGLCAADAAAAGSPMEQVWQGQPWTEERSLVDAQGQARHMIVSYQPDGVAGAVQGLVVHATDITERKHMERELFAEKERMRLTLQAIGDAVVCTDAHGRVTYLNPVAERLTGWPLAQARQQPVDTVVSLNPGTSLRQALERGRPIEHVRAQVQHRQSGKAFDVEEAASPITDAQGQVMGAVAVLRDVTEAVATAARMAHLAQYDALTDLPNRVLLQDRAIQALLQAQRSQRQVAVIYLDLDGFKQINDSLGHEVGDQVLVRMAQTLRAAVREGDTVSRLGGDEFVLLLPLLPDLAPVQRVARQVLQACHRSFELEGQQLQLGVSGGVSLYPDHGTDFTELARRADEAMYAAKHAGRHQIRLYQGPGESQVLAALETAAVTSSSA